MRRTLASLLLFAITASPTFADEPKGDLAKLQGTWTAKVGPNKDLKISLAVKKSVIELTVTRPDDEEFKLTGEIKIDENASPKTSDWIKFTGPDGNDIGDNKAIYKLEGDTWTTCSGGPGNDRPTKFEAGEGGPPNLTVWTRVKEKADEKAPKAADLAKIQGTWTAPAGPNDEVIVTLSVKDTKYTAEWDRGDGTKVELKGDIKIEEKGSTKTIDFVNSQRNDGDDARDNLGIYTFDGEKWKVCLGGAGNPRPKEFNKEDGHLLLNFVKK